MTSVRPRATDIFHESHVHYADGAVRPPPPGPGLERLDPPHGAQLTACRLCNYHWLAVCPPGTNGNTLHCPNCNGHSTDDWNTRRTSIMEKAISSLKQLFPLTYRSYYEADGERHFCVWRMWFGRCFGIDDVVIR